MTTTVIEKAINKAEMMQALDPKVANMVPVTNGADNQYVLLDVPLPGIRSAYQQHDRPMA